MADILKASDIQPEDDPARTLAEKRERKIRKAVTDTLIALAGLYGGPTVLMLVSRYDSSKLTGIVTGDEAERIVIQGYQPIADTFDEAARTAANDGFGQLVVYDPLKAASAQAGIRAGFVDAIQGSAEEVIRLVLLDGLRRNAAPELVARTLQLLVGLTPQQAQAVMNFRRLLQTGDAAALQRALRDRRFDATVQAALRGERSLTPEQVDAMVGRYAERMLAHRAETMAKTEAMQAAVSGIREAYVQAVDSGQLLDSEVRRFWLTAADEQVCPVCSSVPRLNREGRGVNEPYASIEGEILAPLAHPRCRCSERYRADLSRLKYQPFAYAA